MSAFFSKRNLQFLLHEVFKAEDLTRYDYFSAHDRGTFDLALESASHIADTLMYPHLREVDRNQPELKNGQVTVHPKVKEFIAAMGDAEPGFRLKKAVSNCPNSSARLSASF